LFDQAFYQIIQTWWPQCFSARFCISSAGNVGPLVLASNYWLDGWNQDESLGKTNEIGTGTIKQKEQ
jgi:hypothetical protein